MTGSLPSLRSSWNSSSASLRTLELYPPHIPRSLVTTRTAARLGSVRSLSSGWSSEADALASSDRTFVISSAYGFAAATRDCALVMREVAISSWALVIFLVELTDLMRDLSSRMLAIDRSLSLHVSQHHGQAAHLLTVVRLTLICSWPTSPASRASASASFTTRLPSDARKVSLNLSVASTSALALSASRALPPLMLSYTPEAVRCSSSSSSASKRRTSPTGTLSKTPSPARYIDTIWSSTGMGLY